MMRTDHVTGVAKRHHDALADAVRRIGISRRQNHDEFFAAVARDHVGLAGVAAQNARGRLQDSIAGLVSEVFIQQLEVVEIDERDAQWPFVAGRVLEFTAPEIVPGRRGYIRRSAIAARLFLELDRLRRCGLRGCAQGVDFTQRMQAAQHQHLARLFENQFRMLLGQSNSDSNIASVSGIMAPMVPKTWPKAILIQPQTTFGAQRGLGELPLFRIQQEKIGDRTG